MEEGEGKLKASLQQEMKFVKQKLEAKAKAELATEKPASKSQVRMPMLTITKYDGSFAKWLSFWNKFKAEIESADIAPVTKFAHLLKRTFAYRCV